MTSFGYSSSVSVSSYGSLRCQYCLSLVWTCSFKIHLLNCNYADLWSSDYEQHHVLGYFLGHRVLPSSAVGFFSWDIRDLLCNFNHGLCGSCPNDFPVVDVLHWAGSLPSFHRIGSLLGLCLWMALDNDFSIGDTDLQVSIKGHWRSTWLKVDLSVNVFG